jgi:hypothetical protein
MKKLTDYTSKELEAVAMGSERIFLCAEKDYFTCLGCGKKFTLADEWEHAFQGVFIDGYQLPICKACSENKGFMG